jgi:hypothetical protein
MLRLWPPTATWYNNGMNPEQQPQAQPPQPDPSTLHPMVVMQPGEQVVTEIKRHPFGMVGMYVAAGFVILVVAAVAVMLVPNLQNQYNLPNIQLWAYLLLGFISLGMVFALWVANSVYWQNRWVVTTDSITQITQNSLLGRHVSQLSMDNLEDVTVQQDGAFAHMFNFGTLRVETAGERSKFSFPYCPNPNEQARKILEVHEAFVYDKVKRTPPAPVAAAAPQPQPQQPYPPQPAQYQAYPSQPQQPPDYPWQQPPPSSP